MIVTIRTAEPSDLPFMREMLYEAAHWRSGQPRPPIDEALAEPELAKLLDGWGRDGDAGVIAETPDQSPVGATWYRYWTKHDHSYGYIDAATPELAIAVVAEARGQGVGRALLTALIQRAHSENVPRLSLSVEKDNPALKLYESAGFKIAGSVGNAWTMQIAT